MLGNVAQASGWGGLLGWFIILVGCICPIIIIATESVAAFPAGTSDWRLASVIGVVKMRLKPTTRGEGSQYLFAQNIAFLYGRGCDRIQCHLSLQRQGLVV
jgi:hypothetical protein